MKRRRFVMASAACLATVALPARAAPPPPMRVYKSPACGCCGDWVKHLEAAGFEVTVENVGNAGARARLGIPPALGSCHTAEIGVYAIEGHVPAGDIKRLHAMKVQARGLAVPGMPIGSPGMKSGNQIDPYDVLLVRPDGTTVVFASYAAATGQRNRGRT